MSIVKEFTMFCDNCKSLSDIYSNNASAVRTEARAEGWKHLAGRDTCPDYLLEEIQHTPTNNTQQLEEATQ
jgi:hypothetical protein